MRRLIVGLAILVGLAVVGDLAARLWVERRVEDRAAAHLPSVREVDASVESFPFLGRLLWSGDVPHSRLVLRDVTGVGINVAEVRLEIDGATFDRRSLVRGDRVQLVDVDRVRLSVRVSDRALSRVLGSVVQLAPAGVQVRTGGGVVEAQLRVDDRRLVFGLAGVPAQSVPLPSADVLPCEPQIDVQERAVELSCAIADLPPLVLDAVGALAAT